MRAQAYMKLYGSYALCVIMLLVGAYLLLEGQDEMGKFLLNIGVGFTAFMILMDLAVKGKRNRLF